MSPPNPTAVPRQERFQLLDLMRGIAALAVLIYHADKFLGIQLLPNAYLAVDMFFLLSGFVIAHNYDGKIVAGMSLTNFMAQRLIRLYPAFLLTLVLGFIFMSARMAHYMGYYDYWRLFGTGGLNALFIPSYLVPYHAYDDIFPYNGAQWSLSFELIANCLYWLLFPYLNGRRLVLLILLGAAGDLLAAVSFGSFDIGMRPADFLLGFPRVVLPFFTGVALRRYVFPRIPYNLNTGGILASILILLVTFSVSRFFGPGLLAAVEFLTIAVIFPLLLAVVCRTVPSPRMAYLCKLTGDASYPVYLLQVPFYGLFAALPQILLHRKAHDFIPYVGVALVVCTFVTAVWVDRHYELPVRNWLKNVWRSVQQKKAAKAAATI